MTMDNVAGQRWHINCFRCHFCETLLDCDANLLLFGDGTLICNNCTYDCTACGNKIEELAIMIGEQAFCATCFRCRNCKRKIENLRYARSGQSILCMGCHETANARRRKNKRAAAAGKSREKDHSPMVTEKSLPALPPSAIPPNAFSNDRVDPDSDTPTEISPRPRGGHGQNEHSSRGSVRSARPPEVRDLSTKMEGLSLPATTYRKNRNSSIYQSADSAPGEASDSFFIPVALDPSPATIDTPRSISDNAAEGGRRKDKDYFSVNKSSASVRRDDSVTSTPHIAFQEKGRTTSSDHDIARLKSAKFSKSAEQDQRKASSGDDAKLQEAPAPRRGQPTRSNSSHSTATQDNVSSKSSNGVVRKDAYSNLSEARKVNESRTSEDADSFRSTSRPDLPKSITRKEVPSAGGRSCKYHSNKKQRGAIEGPVSLHSPGFSRLTVTQRTGKSSVRVQAIQAHQSRRLSLLPPTRTRSLVLRRLRRWRRLPRPQVLRLKPPEQRPRPLEPRSNTVNRRYRQNYLGGAMEVTSAWTKTWLGSLVPTKAPPRFYDGFPTPYATGVPAA